MRRIFFAFLAVMALAAGRADAVTIRDIIELSKAGLSEPVLLALIEVDRSVFSIDTATLKRLKDSGVSDAVIVALIRSGRTPAAQPVEPAAATTDPAPEPAKEPQVIVIDHHDTPPAAPQQVAVPVAYPVYVPVAASSRQFFRNETVTTVLPTDQGLVRARVPVPAGCIKAQPVFWGFDGKLRPGSWEPPPTVVCR